jgi:hypothetical protein
LFACLCLPDYPITALYPTPFSIVTSNSLNKNKPQQAQPQATPIRANAAEAAEASAEFTSSQAPASSTPTPISAPTPTPLATAPTPTTSSDVRRSRFVVRTKYIKPTGVQAYVLGECVTFEPRELHHLF